MLENQGILKLKLAKSVIFVFTGEFGYELLNWQGKIRKFAKQNPDAKLIAVSKQACELLYRDSTSLFLPLDDAEVYKKSYADRYFSHASSYKYKNVFTEIFDSLWAIIFRRKIKSYLKSNWPTSREYPDRPKYVFSDSVNNFDDIKFGAARTRFSRFFWGNPEDIYTSLPVQDNIYINLQQNLSSDELVSANNATHSDLPIMIIQTAARDRIIRSTDDIDEDSVIKEISSIWNVILLEYRSTRYSDTQGIFENNTYQKIQIENLAQQIAVMSCASVCVSFTHGDFRSNTYVPAFAGMKSIVITDESTLQNSAVEFWNDHVFSGKIIPIIYNSSQSTLKRIQESRT